MNDLPNGIRRIDESIERTLSQFDSEQEIRRQSSLEQRAEQGSMLVVDDSQSVQLLCMKDIVSKSICWLWRGWLAQGKLHILAGAPGTGKTTIALSIAAAITRGGKLPDGSQAPLGKVLIWSGEDDASDTLKPRMLAAGADVSRVFIVGGVGVGEDARPFDPSRDLSALEHAAETIGDISLLIAVVCGASSQTCGISEITSPAWQMNSRSRYSHRCGLTPVPRDAESCQLNSARNWVLVDMCPCPATPNRRYRNPNLVDDNLLMQICSCGHIVLVSRKIRSNL